jgi:GDSL-like Lipase/Acylhydrolase family
VLVIAAITLALDYILTATLFSSLKQAMSDPEARNERVYVAAPYHHDLAPDVKATRVWGNILYPWQTDRFGFRTGDCAPSAPEKGRENIFVIGDSFTEALGSSYEQSFPGLMACEAARQGKAVWNLGVASYSPAIYHRKIRAAAERLEIKPTDIFVFLDLSDIDDDANIYRPGDDGLIRSAQSGERPASFDVGKFLVNNFTTARLLYDLYVTSSFSYSMSIGRPRARWTVDPALLESWGRRGLDVAGANLDRIVTLCREWQCRLTLVVYPWPDNVVAGDRDSIQVTHWRDWAAARNVRFIDGFAPFFREPADTALRKYYIAGDVHFTELGNRLLYDAVKPALGADDGDSRSTEKRQGVRQPPIER